MALFDWEKIRAEYEVGATQSELARRFGCSRTSIQIRIKKEGWVQDISRAVNRLTEAKVAGIVAGCNPQKKAEALNAEADRKAAVLKKHKEEWESLEALSKQAVDDKDFELAKLAKITTETAKIRQDGQRRSWGIADAVRQDSNSNMVVIEKKEFSDDIKAMLDELKGKKKNEQMG